MQFLPHGPEIPERLLHAHEEGRVVFFCGAGVSGPAKLPGFSRLVADLYRGLNVIPSPVQSIAIRAKQYDTAIGLLEDALGRDGRLQVRTKAAELLTPKPQYANEFETHSALLDLSRARDGSVRLITTNFDRLFESARVPKPWTVNTFRAPLLPVPKASRWDGIVYLHGLLPAQPLSVDLERLVLSSGDFGQAYLVERWASQFVSELFKNFTVCFIGYSINDPVLRYMTDALAADVLRGEAPIEMFAFSVHRKGRAKATMEEWQAKNVTPILYAAHNKHSRLHETLRSWAKTYRSGSKGKEQLVVEFATSIPNKSTVQDNVVGRMLWALADSSGLAAKRFADLEPVPSVDWLDPICDSRFEHTDLIRFGVPPNEEIDVVLRFSLADRPTPYPLAPLMQLVGTDAASQWDKVMYHLARWLGRHLGNPRLLHWYIGKGGGPTGALAIEFERRLLTAPDAAATEQQASSVAVSEVMRLLWQLILSGRTRRSRRLDMYQWLSRHRTGPISVSSLYEFRSMLVPIVELSAAHESDLLEDNGQQAGAPVRTFADWQIVLITRDVRHALNDSDDLSPWRAALPRLIDDLVVLLTDALNLLVSLRSASERSDSSYIFQPSIEVHPQNRGFFEWTLLVELVRDAWVRLSRTDTHRARRYVVDWWERPSSTFKRIALFASGHDPEFPTSLLAEWLLQDNAWWLWSIETQREVSRLLVSTAGRWLHTDVEILEQAILNGPPNGMLSMDSSVEQRERSIDRMTWLRLGKLEEAGVQMSNVALWRLDVLRRRYPIWTFTDDQREEFSTWMDVGARWLGERDPLLDFVELPRTVDELVEHLRTQPDAAEDTQDDWRALCRDEIEVAIAALKTLAQTHVWPRSRWREALQEWSEERHAQRSWSELRSELTNSPVDFLKDLDGAFGWWLRQVGKFVPVEDSAFLSFAGRTLRAIQDAEDLNSFDQPDGRAVNFAINHPVGRITEGLFDWWYRSRPEDRQGLPIELKELFSEMADPARLGYRHARVIFAANLISLFRVDRDWTRERILFLFEWTRNESETAGMWQGFLWVARLYPPLLADFKGSFLETAGHVQALGDHGKQYAALLVLVALDGDGALSPRESQAAFFQLNVEALEDAAAALVRAQEASGSQAAIHWNERTRPFMREIWPQTGDRTSPGIEDQFARLAIAAGAEFPAAVALLRPRLRALQHPNFTLHLLFESNHCRTFPEAAVAFLNLIVEAIDPFSAPNFRKCFDELSSAAPEYSLNTPAYARLSELRRQAE